MNRESSNGYGNDARIAVRPRSTSSVRRHTIDVTHIVTERRQPMNCGGEV